MGSIEDAVNQFCSKFMRMNKVIYSHESQNIKEMYTVTVINVGGLIVSADLDDPFMALYEHDGKCFWISYDSIMQFAEHIHSRMAYIISEVTASAFVYNPMEKHVSNPQHAKIYECSFMNVKDGYVFSEYENLMAKMCDFINDKKKCLLNIKHPHPFLSYCSRQKLKGEEFLKIYNFPKNAVEVKGRSYDATE